ncbi:CTSL, partial [Cordylochernes scorpioides]
MKILMKLLLLALVASTALCYDVKIRNEQWEAYKIKFKRSYGKYEEINRRAIWEENMRLIEEHNYYADLDRESFRMGVNHFTDMRHDELPGLKMSNQSSHGSIERKIFQRQINRELPKEVDWSKEGYVTPVRQQEGLLLMSQALSIFFIALRTVEMRFICEKKHSRIDVFICYTCVVCIQGVCGSCWAFSTVGTLEGQLKVKTGNLTVLSPEQLVDCDYYDDGCITGGLPWEAYKYIKDVGGLEPEADYPYVSTEVVHHPCRFNKNKTVVKVKSYVAIESGNEKDLMEAVATIGPISVGIAASYNLKLYRTGIYKKDCHYQLNHAVLLVGYGEENGTPYWLIKN